MGGISGDWEGWLEIGRHGWKLGGMVGNWEAWLGSGRDEWEVGGMNLKWEGCRIGGGMVEQWQGL